MRKTKSIKIINNSKNIKYKINYIKTKDGIKTTFNNLKNEDKAISNLDSILNKKKHKHNKGRERNKEKKETITLNLNIKKIKKVCISFFLIVVIIIASFFGLKALLTPNYNEKMNIGNTALIIGDTKISIGMYNYYYNTIVNNYLSYAEKGYYDIDSNIDYSKQKTTDDDGNEITWADKFQEETINRIQEITAFYEEGKKNKIELSDTQSDYIDSYIDSLQSSADDEKTSVDTYISKQYGSYCGVKTLKKILEQSYIAENYRTYFSTNTKISDKEINEYYQANTNNYYAVTVASISIPYDSSSKDNNATAVLKVAKSYKEKITDKKSMINIIPEACSDFAENLVEQGNFKNKDSAIKAISDSVETTIYSSNVDLTDKTDKLSQWVFDTNRKNGDKEVFVDENQSCIHIVLVLKKPYLRTDKVYSVRHIQVDPSFLNNSTENKEYSDDDWNSAKEAVKLITNLYNNTNKTEYDFSLLAETYSCDSSTISAGSTSFGGLCDAVSLGSKSKQFESWATDKNRKYGDVETILDSDGYHIMFYIDYTDYYKYDARQQLISIKENQITEKYKSKKSISLKLSNILS